MACASSPVARHACTPSQRCHLGRPLVTDSERIASPGERKREWPVAWGTPMTAVVSLWRFAAGGTLVGMEGSSAPGTVNAWLRG